MKYIIIKIVYAYLDFVVMYFILEIIVIKKAIAVVLQVFSMNMKCHKVLNHNLNKLLNISQDRKASKYRKFKCFKFCDNGLEYN